MKVKENLKDWYLNKGASEALINEAISLLRVSLPSDYLQFLGDHNGGEGFLGDNYLILWRAEELYPFNLEYQVEQYAPGLLLFGSDGGGEGYGFDTRNETMPIIRVPFVGMELRYASNVCRSFTELFTILSST